MFRYITILFLIAAFAAQTFQQSLMVLDYYTNTGSYAERCVNKAQPKMHCNGKCQLMKKLQEEEKKSKQAPERKPVNKIEVLSSASSFATLDGPLSSVLSTTKSFYSYTLPNYYPSSIFHPPSSI